MALSQPDVAAGFQPVWRYFDIPRNLPFRGQRRRLGAVVRGPHGWGECSPFPGYGPADRVSGERAAIESACRPWPPALRDWIPVHTTVPAVGPEEAAELVRRSGSNAAKVKVGEGDDEARVEAVRQALGPAGRLVVDANGAWEVDEAISRIRRLSRYGIDLVEQPVRGFTDMAAVRRAVEVPMAADELASSAEAVARIVAEEAADVLVLKVQSLGGVQAGMRVAEQSRLPVVVSSLLETSVGLSAGVALAAALEDLPYPCGLGTGALLAGDLVADPLLPEDGRVPVRRPEVEPSLLQRFAGRPPATEGLGAMEPKK